MYPGVTEKSDDDVYRWLINRAKGGDVVVLTADPVDTPCDLYNGYIYNLSNVAPRPNSVTTICFTNRSDSLNPKVAELLKSATAVRIILFCHVLLRERSFPTFLCGRCQPSGVPTPAPMHAWYRPTPGPRSWMYASHRPFLCAIKSCRRIAHQPSWLARPLGRPSRGRP